jgi:hypothetical protein
VAAEAQAETDQPELFIQVIPENTQEEQAKLVKATQADMDITDLDQVILIQDVKEVVLHTLEAQAEAPAQEVLVDIQTGFEYTAVKALPML